MSDARLERYAELLRAYAPSLNLVSPKVLAELPLHFEAAPSGRTSP